MQKNYEIKYIDGHRHKAMRLTTCLYWELFALKKILEMIDLWLERKIAHNFKYS